jgi:hypothetical protein
MKSIKPGEKMKEKEIRGEFKTRDEFDEAARSSKYNVNLENEYAKDEYGIARRVGTNLVLRDKNTNIIVAIRKWDWDKEKPRW